MDFTEKTVAEHTVYTGRILTVRNDEALLPDGKPCRRELVVHPGAVAVAALNEKQELALIRQFRYPFAAELLEIPAGKLEPGEDPLEAGKRELREEAGVIAGRYYPLGAFYPTPGYCDEVIHLFLAYDLQKTEAAPDEDEFVEALWLPLGEVAELIMRDTLRDGKTQAAVLKLERLLQNGVLAQQEGWL